MSKEVREPKIGLSLSGGGSRAVAFHLGCLRALNDLGILARIEVISTVSGGSVIGALYAKSSGSFQQFETESYKFLRKGLVVPALTTAFTTSEGGKALFSWLVCGVISILQLLIGGALKAIHPFLPSVHNTEHTPPTMVPARRIASRTTILLRSLNRVFLGGTKLKDLPPESPLLIINATELRTGSAFYFSARESGSWRYGKVRGNNMSLAHAVMASAAYPIFLPALDETFEFEGRDGSITRERVILTDGGVYDNLGLAPLWPNRDPTVSLNVTEIDTIICCRAGYGLRHDPPTSFFIERLKSSFAAIHDRAQNASLKRLFDLKDSGSLRCIVLPFLGQDDTLMPEPSEASVPRDSVLGYPTNFSAMSDEWIAKLSDRGEHLTKALVKAYAPHLIEK